MGDPQGSAFEDALLPLSTDDCVRQSLEYVGDPIQLVQLEQIGDRSALIKSVEPVGDIWQPV